MKRNRLSVLVASILFRRERRRYIGAIEDREAVIRKRNAVISSMFDQMYVLRQLIVYGRLIIASGNDVRNWCREVDKRYLQAKWYKDVVEKAVMEGRDEGFRFEGIDG